MKKETKIELFWIILMILFLFIFFMTGCRSTKNHHEQFIEKFSLQE